jgi:anti-sigma regulatory factor (Ser/Thr protein kinase)
MIDSMPAADVANAERFERLGLAATLQAAARTRDEFADWLRQFFELDPTRLSDLVLAINEALANSAEFAYGATDGVGTMDLLAWHDPGESSITVLVADHGEWRMADTAPATRSRGRGIPLMRALSDRTAIETSTHGTQVKLAWENVGRRSGR